MSFSGGLAMRLNRISVSLSALLLAPVVSWAACTGRSPTWSSTPDYASVSRCVRNAGGGDTINVRSGSATWHSSLTINKGIKLIGAGVGNTLITRGASTIIVINNPPNTNLLRISGFTFEVGNGGNEGGAIGMSCSEAAGDAKWNIRIDHNLFTTPSGTCTTGHCYIYNGGCRGVIDNNTFEKAEYPLGVGVSGDFPGATAWANHPDLVFGAANDNLYIEDNIFNDEATTITDCDEGGRYAFRYNTFNPKNAMYPFLDTHGGKGGVYSCMGVEIYGNQFNNPGGEVHGNQSGGRSAGHHNWGVNGYIQISDAEGCPVLQRELLNETYYFLNRDDTGALIGTGESADVECGWMATENRDWWQDNTSCIAPNICSTITTGVGCGTLANLPASCTTGTAFWVTTQSCTDLTGMVGRNPSTPISGTLYKCTAPNTWTAFYTPYTYPHPLRNESGPPAPPANLQILLQ